MVNEKSFITIQAFMVNELHLKGNELLVYAIIYGFSQDGESEFTGSLQYLADWCGTSKQTIISTLQSLCEKQLLLKNVEYKNNIRFCTYKSCMVLKNLEQGSQNSLMGYSKNLNGGSQNSLPNNITDNQDNTITNKKDIKHKLGTYFNVLLSDKELQKLVDELGSEKTGAVIANFSELKEMKGYKYKSDYLALKKWGIDAYEKRNQTSPKQNKNVKQNMANFFDEN